MDEYNDNDDLLPSKSQLKRDQQELQAVGERLMAMKPQELQRLPIHSEILKALDESRRITKPDARRRHALFIGRLIRDDDAERLLSAVAELDNPVRQQRLADWANRVAECPTVKESGTLLEELLSWYPDTDRQQLRNLMRNVINARSTDPEPTADAKEKFKLERRKLARHIADIEKHTPL